MILICKDERSHLLLLIPFDEAAQMLQDIVRADITALDLPRQDKLMPVSIGYGCSVSGHYIHLGDQDAWNDTIDPITHEALEEGLEANGFVKVHEDYVHLDQAYGTVLLQSITLNLDNVNVYLVGTTDIDTTCPATTQTPWIPPTAYGIEDVPDPKGPTT